jgi:hypothetical protein
MSDSGEVTTDTTTFFDTMPVEDFISLLEEFLDEHEPIKIDEDIFDVPAFEEPCEDEPTSLEAPSIDEPVSLEDPSELEPTSSDSDYKIDFDLDAPYSEYEGWGDAEFSYDPTDASYTEWSNAYEYAHDYAEAVWGDSSW